MTVVRKALGALAALSGFFTAVTCDRPSIGLLGCMFLAVGVCIAIDFD